MAEIIRPRVAQILSLARERLAQNGASAYAGDKVVLTGGAAQLLGAAEFTANELGLAVRVGRPVAISGLPATIAGPQFAALSGLAVAASAGLGEFSPYRDRDAFGQGYFGRVGSWLKAGF